jgi:D-tyrosyl-tRNA(Tyr) deacylase
MKAVIQRVSQATVEVEGKTVGKIGRGVLVLLGILQGDREEQASCLAQKVAEFRIFPDSDRKMNLSLLDIRGEALVVSQFTLAADGKKGKRPSFDNAAPPEEAERYYEKFIQQLKNLGIETESGIFGAYMQVSLVNDGPVTFILER